MTGPAQNSGLPIREIDSETDLELLEPEEHRPPEFTDEALALQFAARYADELRYVAACGHWYEWDGTRWREDTTLHAFDRARHVCREAASECNSDRLSKQLASAKTVAAVERLAKSDRRLAATVSQWDADPWLLNCPSGTIDLRTGHKRQHSPNDFITRVTAVSPEGECPSFYSFLDQVTDGRSDLQEFLQRVFGYSLTGTTREHALFFLYGTGANGKSVLLETITGIMGDYHRTAQIETFTASSVDRHPTDVASLHGARLVTATETEEGRRWAESRIKSLTGGDKISARFMRQDPFEFTPAFKLVIAGNHKPGLRSVDEAIRRRFHLLPFDVTIPQDERDSQLAERLKSEWPGILQWILDGCVDWQDRNSLAPPQCVLDATAAYMEAEDAMAAWIEECCDLDPQGYEGSSALFASWKTWAELNGEYPGTARRFSQRLEDKGYEKERTRVGRHFIGLKLRQISNP